MQTKYKTHKKMPYFTISCNSQPGYNTYPHIRYLDNCQQTNLWSVNLQTGQKSALA